MHILRRLTAAALCAFAALPLAAQELSMPEGDILLTIDGAITETNGDGRAIFDRAMLEELGPVTFETTTTWTDGVQTFTGIELATLLEAVGATGDSLTATAVNDYAIDIPREDWVEGGPIVAYLRNGEEMPLREKGPLWVVYPYDTNDAYRTEVIYSRSIWQLDRITVAE
ncbi:molybdopterin-dependent oxidoreductase [Pseudoroseicyclus sp. H15]